MINIEDLFNFEHFLLYDADKFMEVEEKKFQCFLNDDSKVNKREENANRHQTWANRSRMTRVKLLQAAIF